MKTLNDELLLVSDLIMANSSDLEINIMKSARISNAISWIKSELCPKKIEILEIANSRKCDLSLIISEIILFNLGNQIPGLPILSKTIVEIGLDRFCSDPKLLISVDDN